MEFTIKNLERRTRRGLVPSLINPAWTAGKTDDKAGWYAEIHSDKGTLEVSLLDGETAWHADAAWRSNGMPMFSHGFGARYTVPQIVADDVARELDAAVDAATGTVTVNRGTI